MAQQLAKNCTLEKFSGRQIVLCLSSEQKHLQENKVAIEKLQACLSEYFVKPVNLKIVLGENKMNTPAEVERQKKQYQQQQVSNAITQDGFVHEAKTELDATLIAESIKGII
jgi:hypothetical protein